ncbi:MAG: Global regulator protein family [Gammaproteobacteria bacterium]|jgi:carbon storage regulator|nr:Global regulator protein family [Gammaproteobacteria bacterium]
MLVITRRAGQRFFMDGNIIVQVLGSTNETVRLGIEAPRWISVVREELLIKETTNEKSPVKSIQHSCLTTLKQIKDRLFSRIKTSGR